MGFILIGVGWLIFGATCVAWRSQFGSDDPTDGAVIAILLLWPFWLLAAGAAAIGWRHR